MAWRDQVEEGLPPPYNGEPSSLRNDIADELADHLANATERELAAGASEAEAGSRVLDRFGDPRALAHRLWFEAMKERIMRDRILLVAVCLLILTTGAMAALTWFQFKKSQAAQTELIAALKSIAANQGKPAAELGSIKIEARSIIRRRDASNKVSPAPGVTFTLNGRPFTDTEERINAVTDQNGVATFGPIKPGAYDLLGKMNNGLGRYFKPVVLYAGAAETVKAEVPHFEQVKLHLKLALPDFLKGRDVSALINIRGHASSNKLLTPDQSDPEAWNIEHAWVIDNEDRVRNLKKTRSIQNIGTFWEMGGNIGPLELPGIQYAVIERRYGLLSDASKREYIMFGGDSQMLDTFILRSDQTPGLMNTDMTHVIPWPVTLNTEAQLAIIGRDLGTKIDRTILDGIENFVTGHVAAARPIVQNADSAGKPLDNLWLSSGSAKIFLNWPPLDPELTSDTANHFIIAICHDGSSSGPSNKQIIALEARPVTVHWNEDTATSSTLANAAADPSAPGSIDEQKKWIHFDITPFVRQQAQAPDKFHGVQIAVDPTHPANKNKQGGYGIHPRISQYPPTLLIVKPHSQHPG